ncbi:sigma-70 family RNA polymerase sigma factor [Pedobacter insulae]|uniref:sigma-70 family RNA polymerase sigma factor n=1 Tax=Pedobacter insulae TaxID=414048 RepID=UPI0015A607BD|nr:sigma-70 family RNA polymerase sigma factor [Pedobacter insulae]
MNLIESIDRNSHISSAQFDLLFHENYEDLCLTAVKYVKDPALAQDLVQEFFVYFWNKRETIVVTSTFKAYATRAVTNVSITYLKRKKNHVIYQDELPDLDFDPEYLLSEELIKSTKISRLMQLIKGLPPERKKLFLMSNVLGLTYAEIAAKNNISINTVKTQIKKAYAYLRSNMGDIISLFF